MVELDYDKVDSISLGMELRRVYETTFGLHDWSKNDDRDYNVMFPGEMLGEHSRRTASIRRFYTHGLYKPEIANLKIDDWLGMTRYDQDLIIDTITKLGKERNIAQDALINKLGK